MNSFTWQRDRVQVLKHNWMASIIKLYWLFVLSGPRMLPRVLWRTLESRACHPCHLDHLRLQQSGVIPLPGLQEQCHPPLTSQHWRSSFPTVASMWSSSEMPPTSRGSSSCWHVDWEEVRGPSLISTPWEWSITSPGTFIAFIKTPPCTRWAAAWLQPVIMRMANYNWVPIIRCTRSMLDMKRSGDMSSESDTYQQT